MTKVHERSVVPAIDAELRARLAATLARSGITAAYLFGSQARGEPGPLSDVDIAVLPEPGAHRLDLRLEIAAAAAAAIGSDEVDVVLLDTAPPLLRHRVLRDAVLLVDRDPRARVRFETRALLDYFDTASLREALAAGRRRRLAEGRFGRR